MTGETRNTIQRQLVLDAVTELKNHPTAEDVYAKVIKKYRHISKATVYNNLKVLSEMGSLKKIEVPNQSARYDHQTYDHYHLRCNECGKVLDSTIKFDESLKEMFKESNGFLVKEFNIILNGICCECNKKRQA